MAETQIANAHAIAQSLREQFTTQTPPIQGFSSTLYCVYQYPNAETVKITVGRLVANDTPLHENWTDAWIAPQNYAVFEITHHSADTWAQIQQNTELNRRFHADFEIYPTYGSPKIYIGLQGDVEINEEVL